MAVSFSAEYLYQGAKVLSRNPVSIGVDDAFECPGALFAVARGVYALGVLVIAPVGMVYHAGAAGVYYARSFVERDVAPLNELVDEHLDALGADSIGFMVSVTGPILVASLVALVFFQIYVCIVPLALSAYGVLYADLPKEFFLPLGYAQDPRVFESFLIYYGQKREYGAYHVYNKLVREGVAVDEPLTDGECGGLYEILRRRDPWPFYKAMSVYRFLLRADKMQPAYQARLRAFVNSQDEIQRIHNELFDDLRPQIADNNVLRETINRHFIRRVHRIIAALPPVGAPVPAAGPAPAQA